MYVDTTMAATTKTACKERPGREEIFKLIRSTKSAARDFVPDGESVFLVPTSKSFCSSKKSIGGRKGGGAPFSKKDEQGRSTTMIHHIVGHEM
jgi:hypothetical protein